MAFLFSFSFKILDFADLFYPYSFVIFYKCIGTNILLEKNKMVKFVWCMGENQIKIVWFLVINSLFFVLV